MSWAQLFIGGRDFGVVHNLCREAPTKRNEPILADLTLLQVVAERFLILFPVFLLEVGNDLVTHRWRDGHVIEAVPCRTMSKAVKGWRCDGVCA
jgi:hypothetical protein